MSENSEEKKEEVAFIEKVEEGLSLAFIEEKI